MSTASLELIMRLQDEASKELKRLQGELVEVGKKSDETDKKTNSLFSNMSAVAGGFLAANILGKITSGLGDIAHAMIGGNAEFEQYNTRFSVLLGSADEAKKRMADLAAFGASTPFDLPEVVKADTVLQGFGLHSEEAAKKFGFSGEQIRTIAGDVASGTGASFEEMSLLIGKFSAGATGEAISRMQEMGITNRDELTKMGLEFSKAGQLLSPLPEAMQTVLGLMKTKYGGLMDAQSSTFDGMMSNASDFMGGLAREIGAPIFERLKTGLTAALAFFNDPATKAAIADFAAGLGTALDVMSDIAGFIMSNLKPALIALGVTTMLYAATQLPAMIASLTTAIPLLYAKGVALTASLGPLALVGAAIFGVAKAWDSYNQTLEDGATKALDQEEFWQSAATTMKAYTSSSEEMQASTKSAAQALELEQNKMHALMEATANRHAILQTTGQMTEEIYTRDLALLNQQADAVLGASAALKTNMEIQQGAANAAGVDIQNIIAMQGHYTEAISLSAEEYKKLDEALAKFTQEGAQALGQAITVETDFISQRETKRLEHETKMADLRKAGNEKGLAVEKESYAAENVEQDIAYVAQMTRLLAHEGEMLISWVSTQQQMGNVTKEQAAEMTGVIVDKFGVAKDSSVLMFGQMANAIMDWARTGKGSAEDIVLGMLDLQHSATDTRLRQEELGKSMTKDIEEKAKAGKWSTDQLTAALLAIPGRVNTIIEIEQRLKPLLNVNPTLLGNDVASQLPTRAAGGPVDALQPYLVGENGPELFIPGASGAIVPDGQTSELLGRINLGQGDSSAAAQIQEQVRNLLRSFDATTVNLTGQRMRDIQTELENMASAIGGRGATGPQSAIDRLQDQLSGVRDQMTNIDSLVGDRMRSVQDRMSNGLPNGSGLNSGSLNGPTYTTQDQRTINITNIVPDDAYFEQVIQKVLKVVDERLDRAGAP